MIGNLGFSFTNIFVSHDLSTNFFSVGQLVKENYSFYFYCFDCCVQA